MPTSTTIRCCSRPSRTRAQRVLEVGCGDGILSAQLAQAGVPHVVGLDLDAGALDRARARHADTRIEWVHGDVFAVPFEPGSFDAVVSAATLHHVDAAQGLVRFADLVRPGGVVRITRARSQRLVGLALRGGRRRCSDRPRSCPWALGTLSAHGMAATRDVS